MEKKDGRRYHLIVLAKNETDHNGDQPGQVMIPRFVTMTTAEIQFLSTARDVELVAVAGIRKETFVHGFRVELVAARKRLFKPIFGCEMYVAPRRLDQMEKGRPAVSFNRVG